MNAFLSRIIGLLLFVYSVFSGFIPGTSNAPEWKLDGVPAYNGGILCDTLYDTGSGRESDWKDASPDNNNYMQLVRGGSLSSVTQYCKELQSGGWELLFENEIEGNHYYCLNNSIKQIFINYSSTTREVRIMDDSCSSRPDTFGYTYDGPGSATVYQFGFPYYDKKYNNNEDLYSNNGMLYVVRLADNKLIIIDGGSTIQATDANVEAFMSFLRSIASVAPGENIEVALWFGTHAHSDHISFFSKVLCLHSEEIDVERFMFNYWSYASFEYSHRVDWFRTQINRLYPQAQYIKCRSGFAFPLADADIEVIYSHEDAVDAATGLYTSEEANDGTSVLRMTLGGSSFLFLGDADVTAQNEMLRRFTYVMLSADVVQASHHMYNNLQRLYAGINPSYVMVPQSKYRSETDCDAYKTLRLFVDKGSFYFASEGTYGFTPDGSGKISVEYLPLATGAYDGSDIVYDFPE